MLTNPDTVTNLREDMSARTASTLGLIWDDGSATGGSPIISYQVSQAIAPTGRRLATNADWQILFSVYEKKAVIQGLEFGTEYLFYV